ncbi:hypothetical protein [Brumimicrobium aurantiacum]|uniref:Uncharacterized protein n=1 Tax=Brumimicrobium aurantiacum TaxID=1737063 RepID=A0A3E1EYJ2_9FLAO|nr:hypothetical protein [Brumimicrobium aurantiacum]RFC54631.1 hypothetical protein DXU93_06485 [Brumimicrobium aurantiacum]
MSELETLKEDNGNDSGFPKGLRILLILSSIYIAFTLIGALQQLLGGPLTEVQIEEQAADIYGGLAQLEDEGFGSDLKEMAETMINSAIYTNNEVFYLNYTLRLIESLIGAIAIVLMFQLKRIGFHVYIIYSIFPVIAMYLTMPQEFILTMSVVSLLLIGALFSLLYGRHIKHLN